MLYSPVLVRRRAFNLVIGTYIDTESIRLKGALGRLECVLISYSMRSLYKDYSINEFLFHWQSQSNTSSSSKTGQRYINHRNMNSKVVLFVREHKNNKKLNIADSYTFLGKAEFVSYKGSKPMNIIWKLEEAIPSNFINKTNKLVAR